MSVGRCFGLSVASITVRLLNKAVSRQIFVIRPKHKSEQALGSLHSTYGTSFYEEVET